MEFYPRDSQKVPGDREREEEREGKNRESLGRDRTTYFEAVSALLFFFFYQTPLFRDSVAIDRSI